jgi:PIN domain nuclease of toxin-antitoxin system
LKYLADTVTLVRHFSDSGRVGKAARTIMDAADSMEHSIYVSIVSLMEILYLSEKNRILIDLDQAIDAILARPNYEIVELDVTIMREAKLVHGLELHDRLIVSTARVLGVPMITCDERITDSGLIEVIWK